MTEEILTMNRRPRGRPRKQEGALAVQQAPPTLTTLIERAVTDIKDPAILREMMELQKDIMAKNAEMSFNSAVARLNLPVLKHTAQIKHKNTVISTYTKYEDMDRIIRPIYQAEGFSFSFDSKKNEDKTKTYFATLSHVDGHHRTAQLELPDDAGGAKNAVQAVASTVSYAKRYLVQMLLNIVTEGEDDDGQTGGTAYITPEQEIDLDTWITSLRIKKADFLNLMGVESLALLPAADHRRATNILNEKQKELHAKGVKV